MHLLNSAVAVAAALVGTLSATAAYGTLNTTPVGHTEPVVEPVMLTHYLPCEPPAKLTDGVCVTTVVRTVVKTAEPVVITTVEKKRSAKNKASAPSTSAERDDDGDHHEDGDEDDHGHDQDDDD